MLFLHIIIYFKGCQIFAICPSSNGQLTLNIFRKFALALHKNFIGKVKTKTKPSVKSSMFKTLLSKDTLFNVLRSSFTDS